MASGNNFLDCGHIFSACGTSGRVLVYGEGGVLCDEGISSTIIMPHHGVIIATKPLLDLFVPVVNDLVEASVVISEFHLTFQSFAVLSNPSGNAVVQEGFLKPTHTIHFHQA